MFKQVLPLERTKNYGGTGCFVRVTTKMIYFSSDADFSLVGKYVKIFYDKQKGILFFQVSNEGEFGVFKVSPCHEARRAGRIETWNTIRALNEVGFPLLSLGDPLEATQLPDGSVLAYVNHYAIRGENNNE